MKLSRLCHSVARRPGVPALLLTAGLLLASSVTAAQAPMPAGGGDPGKPPVDKILLDPAPIPAGGGEAGKPRIAPAPAAPEHAAPPASKQDQEHPRKPHHKPRKKVVPAAGGDPGGAPKASSGGAY